MDNMQELINRSYYSVIKRGKIKHDTTIKEFIQKMQEELDEIKLANKENKLNQIYLETVDLVNVCLCFLEHNKQDLNKLFIEIIEKNEQRKD